MMGRRARQFGKRRAAFRNEHKRFLVVTDGVVTEKTYFTYLKRVVLDQIMIKAKNVDIDKLLDIALDVKAKSPFDGVAIVCDIDERLKSDKTRRLLEETMMRAEENGVEMCLSHESFDIWVLMHSGKKIPANVSERARAEELLIKYNMVEGTNNKSIKQEIITVDTVKLALACTDNFRKRYGGDILSCSPLTDVDKIVRKMVLCGD